MFVKRKMQISLLMNTCSKVINGCAVIGHTHLFLFPYHKKIKKHSFSLKKYIIINHPTSYLSTKNN